jgi:hypothetical protein
MARPLVVVLAAAMALTALFCAGRLAVGLRPGRRGEPAVDVLHLTMALAMGATLVGVVDPAWDTALVVAFVGGTLWFARAGLIQLTRAGWRAALSVPGARHGLQHAAGCVAMLAMLLSGSASYGGGVSAGSPAMQGMPGMGRVAAAGSGSLLGLMALAVGVSVLVLTAADTAAVARSGAGSLSSGRDAGRGQAAVLAPRCAAGCRIAMGLTMGVALLAML